MLGIYGKPLIDEYVEVWQYGPVIRTLYSVVKPFRSGSVEPRLRRGPEKTVDDEQKNIMDQVVKVYENFTGFELSRLTHKEGTPWSQVKQEKGINHVIPDELIQKHFEGLLPRG